MNKAKIVLICLIAFLLLRVGATAGLYVEPRDELVGVSMMTIWCNEIGSIPQFAYGSVFLLMVVLLCMKNTRTVGCIFGVLLMLSDIVYAGITYWYESNPVHVTVVMSSLLGIALLAFCGDVSQVKPKGK